MFVDIALLAVVAWFRRLVYYVLFSLVFWFIRLFVVGFVGIWFVFWVCLVSLLLNS